MFWGQDSFLAAFFGCEPARPQPGPTEGSAGWPADLLAEHDRLVRSVLGVQRGLLDAHLGHLAIRGGAAGLDAGQAQVGHCSVTQIAASLQHRNSCLCVCAVAVLRRTSSDRAACSPSGAPAGSRWRSCRTRSLRRAPPGGARAGSARRASRRSWRSRTSAVSAQWRLRPRTACCPSSTAAAEPWARVHDLHGGAHAPPPSPRRRSAQLCEGPRAPQGRGRPDRAAQQLARRAGHALQQHQRVLRVWPGRSLAGPGQPHAPGPRGRGRAPAAPVRRAQRPARRSPPAHGERPGARCLPACLLGSPPASRCAQPVQLKRHISGEVLLWYGRRQAGAQGRSTHSTRQPMGQWSTNSMLHNMSEADVLDFDAAFEHLAGGAGFFGQPPSQAPAQRRLGNF